MDEEKLILENTNLIYHVLQKLKLYAKRDEYYDVGLIGLIKGVKQFNPQLNFKLSTYLYKCIENEILREIRMENSEKRKCHKNAISLDTPLKVDERLTLSDVIPSDFSIEEQAIEEERIQIIYKEISNLSEKERLTINYYFGLNEFEQLKEVQIAERLNVSQAYVNKIKNKAVQKIKDRLEVD